MRIIILLFCTFFLLSTSLAQSTEASNKFKEFLVELAWKNHPTSDIFRSKLKIADLETKAAKLGYWDAVLPFLSFSNGNLPFTDGVVGNPTGGNGVSFGLSVRLAPLYTTELEIEAAKENAKIVKLEREGGKIALRNKVLSLYNQYLFAQKIVEERQKVELEAIENQKLVLELFKQDAAEYEDINSASTALYKATEDRIRAELEIELSDIAIEEWIGMKVEAAELLFMNSN
ncbi:MAG: TolC family protein [Bacteroidota bacterium]